MSTIDGHIMMPREISDDVSLFWNADDSGTRPRSISNFGTSGRLVRGLRRHRRHIVSPRLSQESPPWGKPTPLSIGGGKKCPVERLPCSLVACFSVNTAPNRKIYIYYTQKLHREVTQKSLTPTLTLTLALTLAMGSIPTLDHSWRKQHLPGPEGRKKQTGGGKDSISSLKDTTPEILVVHLNNNRLL